MKIKNNYHSTIILPVNQSIAIGEEIDYADWDLIKDRPNVAWYTENGHLTVSESDAIEEDSEAEDSAGVPEAEVAPEVDEVVEGVQITEEVNEESDEDAQKEALIAQLKELDIKADKRSSVERLQEKLDEALAQ